MSAPQRARSRRAWLLLAALVAIAAGSAWWFSHRPPEQAPATVFRLIDGRRLPAEALRGSPWLVNFWSTSCGVCMAEMPELARLHRRFADEGFTVVAVAAPYDPPSAVLDYAAEARLPFPLALDWDGTNAAAFGGLDGTPVSFLVDAEGRIVERQQGRLDSRRLARLLRSLTAG